MKILAIRFARLGDVLLMLPSLASIKDAYPNSRLTLLTGQPCEPIAEMSDAIDDVIAVDRVALRDGPIIPGLRSIRELLTDVRHRAFDLVVDFHSFRETNLLTWLSHGTRRVGLKRFRQPYLGFCFNEPPILEDKTVHVAEMFSRVAERLGGLPVSDARSITAPSEALKWADDNLLAGKRRLVLYVDAPVTDRRWPPRYFAGLADHAVEEWGAEVSIISGTSGEELLRQVLSFSRNPSRLQAFSQLTLHQLAAVVSSASVLVSNDTGPMHLGPALGVPTLGLFSVGFPEHFRPFGTQHNFLRGNPIERIEMREAIQAVAKLWKN